MYSFNASVFLVRSAGAKFLNRLKEKRTVKCIYLNFNSSSTVDSKFSGFKKPWFKPVSVEPYKNKSKIGEELSGSINKNGIVKVLSAFYRKPELKMLAAENGLDENILQKGFHSFRNYCLESETLPPELHIVFSDLIRHGENSLDLFPYLLDHIKKVFPHLECLEDLKKIGDIREPANWYPLARKIKRKFYFHCGPTNSGKTYHALQRFFNANSGIYCAPLKLLAVEVQQKANQKGTICDLVTGEEVIFMQENGESSCHMSCTVEMCPLDKPFEVAVIDEIQMIKDYQRGWAWTRALLGLQAEEIHICGEEAALEIVDLILCTTEENIEVKRYDRLTKLTISQPVEKYENIQPGDCIVCFNKNQIYSVANTLENLGHKVAIIYGSLPPQTKLLQCEMFNNPKDPHNILVATDAVGMGLNLNIKRIIFFSLMKNQTTEDGDLGKGLISVSQALQIAGRAGRYGTEYDEGYVTTFNKNDLKTLKLLLQQKPKNLIQAGLLPTVDLIEMFSYYLPKTTLCDLMDLFCNFCTVDDSLYFMCDLKDFKILAQLIEHVPIPLRVKIIFCFAPINRKIHFVCIMFVRFAKMYCNNQVITAAWVCKRLGWPPKKPESLRDLIMLETCYEVFELYLWLSYRFEEYFPDSQEIKRIQQQTEILIQSGVQNFVKIIKKTDDSSLSEQEKLNLESSLMNRNSLKNIINEEDGPDNEVDKERTIPRSGNDL